MRVDVFFFLIISFEISSSARSKSKTNSTASGSHFCDRDRGEILFKAQAVILARVRKKVCFIFHSLQYQVKSLAAKDRSTEVMVKVAQVAATNVNTYVITTSTTTTTTFTTLRNIDPGVEGKRTRVDSSEGATSIEV